MHTFFINTSDKDILSDRNILDIEEINKDLILLDYPLKKWKEEDWGYHDCANKIGELIDNYKEINNDFDIVIYVDLMTIPMYSSVLLCNDDNKKTACHFAFYSVICNYIRKTLITELNDHARVPLEVIVIMEEAQRKKVTFDINVIDNRKLLTEMIGRVIGFPSDEELQTVLNKHCKDLYTERESINDLKDEALRTERRLRVSITDEMVELLITELNSLSEDSAFEEQYEYYKDKLTNMLARIVDNADIRELREGFLYSIFESYNNERKSDNGFFFTSFVTDKKVIARNLTENLKRNLRIYFYLTSCIREQTFIESADANGDPVRNNEYSSGAYYRAKDIAFIDRNGWYKIRDYLSEKNRIYKRKLEITLKMRKSYSSLGLAPALDVFDRERLLPDVHCSKDGIVPDRLFDKDTVKEFDYDGLEIVKEMKTKPQVKPAEYINTAHRLRDYHVKYLEELQNHVMNVLSGYAQSDENSPPALSKRVVNIDTNVINEEGTKCRYKKAEADAETEKNVIVEKNAVNVYNTVQNMYFEYCASNELAVSDISLQCNWLEQRIKQIWESLKYMKQVGAVSLIAALVTFVPYIIIGWNNITSSVLSFFTAFCSIAIPCLLFAAIFFIVVAWQKSKLKKVWSEFWKKHLDAIEKNKQAALHYDRLLTYYIPALRYTYEYYLDVQFRKECERLAESKISHHIQMLQNRIKITDKILSDLQLGSSSQQITLSDTEYHIDYHRTYCNGKDNIETYSIIDDKALDLIYGG